MIIKRCFGYRSKSQYRIWQRALANDPSWPPLNQVSSSDLPGCGRGVSYSNPVFESNEEQLWRQWDIHVDKQKQWQKGPVSVIFKQRDYQQEFMESKTYSIVVTKLSAEQNTAPVECFPVGFCKYSRCSVNQEWAKDGNGPRDRRLKKMYSFFLNNIYFKWVEGRWYYV